MLVIRLNIFAVNYCRVYNGSSSKRTEYILHEIDELLKETESPTLIVVYWNLKWNIG